MKNKFLISSIVFSIIGIIYTFLPYKLLTKTLNLGFNLRHNDHIMIGTIALTIAVTSIYTYLNRKDNSN